jgi:hypothetical protein
MTTVTRPAIGVATATLLDYYDEVQRVCAAVRRARTGAVGDGDFVPPFELPPLSAAWNGYFSAAELGCTPLGSYGGVRLALLDLMRNPRTRTTKTLASLLMVARAVHHIQRTGERIMILTPSSANKATALRDAVLRAIEAGLVTPDQLRIAVVVPEASRAKLWSSPLATDPELAQRNPVMVYAGPDRSAVKTIARSVVDSHAAALHSLTGLRLWYSLDIDNYRTADATRALFERDHLAAEPGVTRLHAHAVSSAYGLLGHHLGHTMAGVDAADPRYFLVQHLDTPDMVLSLHFGSTSHKNIPVYRPDPDTGLYTQDSDPRFPATTFDPGEVLDPTFYTRQPPTSAQMNALIGRGGGGGVVVSLHECLVRYPRLRALLAPAGVRLPADPRQLREWSLVMCATGVLNAIDRGLITDDEVLLHGSGCYAAGDYTPLPPEATHAVQTPCDVRQALFYAALVGSCR